MEKINKLIENYIIEEFKINQYELHCPECLQYALLGVKNKDNKIYIIYKCRNHNGEILIEDFMKSQNYSINNLCCYYCKSLEDIFYCFECQNSYCKNCESEHIEKNHSKIFKKEDYNKICPKHFKYYKVYCETCNLFLCEDCPPFHIEHNLSKISIYYEDELNKIKNEINKIEEERNKLINNIKSYNLKLVKKLKEFIINTQIQIQFIKIIMKSYNNKNNQFFNYERYLNLKNLKLKGINSIEINDFLNKEYNIIDEYEININPKIEEKGINDR